MRAVCEILNVSRSGFYAWRDETETQREREGGALVPVVCEVVRAVRVAGLPWNWREWWRPRVMSLPGIGAVFYDVSHEARATFGWE